MAYKYRENIENELFIASEVVKGFVDYDARMEEIKEVYEKAEKYDALMAEPEEPEELKHFTAIVEVPNGTRMETIKLGLTVKNRDTAIHLFSKESEKMGGTLSTVYKTP